jgi:hypothetical protein
MGLRRHALARTAAQVSKMSKESCKRQMTGNGKQQLGKGKQHMTCKLTGKGKRTGKGKCKRIRKGALTMHARDANADAEGWIAREQRDSAGGRVRTARPCRQCRQHHQDCTRKRGRASIT